METAAVLITSKAWVGRKQSKCTFVHGCVYVFVPMCASVCARERGKDAGYFILKLISFWTPEASVYVGLNSCKLLDWLWCGCRLAGDWVDVFCSLHVCLCVCDHRVLLVPPDCRVPQVPQETLVRGWVKACVISRLMLDVLKKHCHSTRHGHWNVTTKFWQNKPKEEWEIFF